MTRHQNDHFQNYRQIQARRHSIATCGHGITVGERIGWNPRNKNTQCKDCWTRWITENHEADMAERYGC